MLRSTLLFFLTIASVHAGTEVSNTVQIDEGTSPNDIRQANDPGQAHAQVLIPAFQTPRLFFSECNDFIASNPVQFSIGTHAIVCKAAGSSGVTISFNVVVFDCEAPQFTDCELKDNTAVAAPGETSAPVFYTPPPATDNDGVTPMVVCEPQPGSSFSVGTTPVTCAATDGAGNFIAIATHQVTVTATPLEPIDPSPVLPCGPHELKNDDDGSCQACPAGQVPNGDDTGCVFCEKGKVRGNQEGTAASGCVFAHGICDVWEKGVNGQCKDCPAGKIGKPDERGCMYCPPGTVRGNSAGNLQSRCVEAGTVCDTNSEIGINGKCLACEENYGPDVSFSTCLPDRPDQNTRK